MKYYPSARSPILGLIIWGVLLVVFGLSLNAAIQDSKTSNLIMLLLFWIIIFLFMGIVWFGTGYYVRDDQLIIKIGPVTHSKISLSKITKISKSNSWISSPANSLKRLEIKSGNSVLVLISPKDQEKFMTTINKINPKIEFKVE
ncbi:MAG: PH domain-containing protein [Flavobacteriaceae bacterium]